MKRALRGQRRKQAEIDAKTPHHPYSSEPCQTAVMLLRAIPGPIWFAAALVPMVASQIVRLHLHDPAAWILCDYAGRLGGLSILVAIPSARAVAFRWDRLRLALWKVALWIGCLVISDHYLGSWVSRTINTALPGTVLGTYPQASGWLYLVDVVFGLALVAYSEEIVFRRCARHVFHSFVGNGFLLVLLTSVLFGAYHWWTGVGNIVEAIMMGILLMLFLLRSEALWPVVLCHYVTDIVGFA